MKRNSIIFLLNQFINETGSDEEFSFDNKILYIQDFKLYSSDKM